jgi:hypothetical protein
MRNIDIGFPLVFEMKAREAADSDIHGTDCRNPI